MTALLEMPPRKKAAPKTRPLGDNVNVSVPLTTEEHKAFMKLVGAGDVSKAEYIRHFLRPALKKRIVLKTNTAQEQQRDLTEPEIGDDRKPGKS